MDPGPGLVIGAAGVDVREDALELGVHVEVRDDADLLVAEDRGEVPHRRGVGPQIRGLRFGEGALGDELGGGDAEGGEGTHGRNVPPARLGR